MLDFGSTLLPAATSTPANGAACGVGVAAESVLVGWWLVACCDSWVVWLCVACGLVIG